VPTDELVVSLDLRRRWASPGEDFNYPQTGVSFWFCATTPNESAGLGWFVARKVRQLNSRAPVHCDTRCEVEGIYGDAAKVDMMEQGCVDRHRDTHG
jgi:hypothetical protein